MGCAKGPVANVLWESLHVSSLWRGASHKVLYFLLLRAPDGTDLLTMFKGEGCLPFFPALNRRPLLQPAHSPLLHRQRAGCRWGPPKPGALPTLRPRVGIITAGQQPAASHSSEAFTSHLSRRNPSSPVVTTLKSLPKSAFPTRSFALPETCFLCRRGLLSRCCSPDCDLHHSTDKAGISEFRVLLFLYYWLSEGQDFIF